MAQRKKPDIKQRVWIDNYGYTDSHHLRRSLEREGLTIVELPLNSEKVERAEALIELIEAELTISSLTPLDQRIRKLIEGMRK